MLQIQMSKCGMDFIEFIIFVLITFNTNVCIRYIYSERMLKAEKIGKAANVIS